MQDSLSLFHLAGSARVVPSPHTQPATQNKIRGVKYAEDVVAE